MRTDQEIIAKIQSIIDSKEFLDIFGVQVANLVSFLPFEAAKPFLKPEVTSSEWDPTENTEGGIKSRVADYLPFAWGKANNCRGLSAGRSVDHMRAYFWLLGEDAFVNSFDSLYEFYGKPILVLCSEKVGFPWREHDDGEWRNSEDGAAITPEEGMRRKGVPLP